MLCPKRLPCGAAVTATSTAAGTSARAATNVTAAVSGLLLALFLAGCSVPTAGPVSTPPAPAPTAQSSSKQTPSKQTPGKQASSPHTSSQSTESQPTESQPAQSPSETSQPDDEADSLAALTYHRIDDGLEMATADEKVPRPALSLIKLYLATYIVEHGTPSELDEAMDMVKSSNDDEAADLYERYPDSIDAVAAEYGLTATKAAPEWGYSVTSTRDVVDFIVQLLHQNPTHPVLAAMSHTDAIAADGQPQNYGTATLPGVIGSKFGWSNEGDLHSSVSFGSNFVVAASITGSDEDLTNYVQALVTDANVHAASEYLQNAHANHPDEQQPTPVFPLPDIDVAAPPAGDEPLPQNQA